MNKIRRVVVDLKNSIWQPTGQELQAEQHLLSTYRKRAKEFIGNQPIETIVLTGSAPVWLYLAIFDELRNTCDKLAYNSPKSGEVLIVETTEDGVPQLVKQ